jgi:hypothetical protein
MSVPASAWAMHEAEHGVVQVSVDAHHHHDDEGGVSLHSSDQGEPTGNTADGGHDHMPSTHQGAGTVPNSGVFMAVPAVVRAAFAVTTARGVDRHGSDGLRRPPRLG